MSDIEAENPETAGTDDGQEVGILTVGDLIEQLQEYDPQLPARTVIRAFDEDEGRDNDDMYDLMYTEKLTDQDPESPTVGEDYVALVVDLRTPDEDDEEDFQPAGENAG